MAQADTFAEYRAQLVDTDPHKYNLSKGGSQYDRDEGILAIPVMGPVGTAPLQVRVHAPVGYRTVRYEAASAGTPPLLPAPADTDSGDAILHSSISLGTPQPLMGGGLMFTAACEYTFVQPAGGRGTENTFPMDKHPFPTMIDHIDLLPAPTGDVELDANWQWNCSFYDMRILGTYNLFT